MYSVRTYYYKVLALIVAGAFAYVQFTALTCGINRIVDLAEIEHHHPFGHDHHHAHGNIPEDHHHDSGAHHETDCCSDFTSAFFSAFGKAQTINPTFSLKQQSVDLVVPIQGSSSVNSHIKEEKAISDQPYPPPKIPDIRIHIRSFQI